MRVASLKNDYSTATNKNGKKSMNNIVEILPNKVKDMSLSKLGRYQIGISEKEMPGLMSLRKQYSDIKPLAGFRLTGSLHMTTETAILIETLKDLGADVEFISRIGKDFLGNEILKELKSRGVSTIFLQEDPIYPTGKVTVSIDFDGSAKSSISAINS